MKGVLGDYDVVILLGLIQSRDVAVEIAVQADTSWHHSLHQAEKAGLYSLLRQKVQCHAFYEFLTSGLKYIFLVDLEKPL